MMEQTEVAQQVSPELEQTAARRARDRAGAARWNLDVAVFLFAVLIIVIILLFQEVKLEVVAPIALFGLAMVWLVGWRRGRQLYQGFYEEELSRLERESVKTAEGTTVDETIEEKVQKALRERWR